MDHLKEAFILVRDMLQGFSDLYERTFDHLISFLWALTRNIGSKEGGITVKELQIIRQRLLL